MSCPDMDGDTDGSPQVHLTSSQLHAIASGWYQIKVTVFDPECGSMSGSLSFRLLGLVNPGSGSDHHDIASWQDMSRVNAVANLASTVSLGGAIGSSTFQGAPYFDFSSVSQATVVMVDNQLADPLTQVRATFVPASALAGIALASDQNGSDGWSLSWNTGGLAGSGTLILEASRQSGSLETQSFLSYAVATP